MGIAGGIRLEAAVSSYLALGAEVFAGGGVSLASIISRRVPCDGEYLEIDSLGAIPAVQEIVGSRRWGNVRAYVNRARVKRYGPDGLTFPILKIVNDRTGLVSIEIANYLRANADFMERPIWDFLITNPTGIDGVSILNDSHPYAYGGGTWDNKTTNALSPSEFATGIEAMEGLRLENGEPAGYYPDTLMVGPSNRKMAIDLCGTDRVVPIAATGLEAYSSALAAAAKTNWIQETPIKVVVNPRFVGSYSTNWLLLDTKKEQARPIIVGDAMPPQAIAITDPQSTGMADRSEARFYAEGQSALMGGVPFGIYGLLA